MTHLAIPMTSKLLLSENANGHEMYNKLHSKDMGFALNKMRLRFTASNTTRSRRIEIMIMERVQADLKAAIKVCCSERFEFSISMLLCEHGAVCDESKLRSVLRQRQC